jgi:CHAD domain-containing protein
MHTSESVPTAPPQKSGLLYWAQRAVEECDNASRNFAADPVHDLRVAIRRCRSMADGFLSVDPDPAWKQMKRMGKPLFAALGELRDVQVMMEWIDKLSHPENPARPILLLELQVRENALKAAAQEALASFDRKHWLSLNAKLAERAEKITLDGTIFQVLALERWNDARVLHRQALRNRSATAYHQLRIGIKRLRYTVENFLPTLHEKWSKDVRDLQDALGEVHDFDVLWALLQSHRELTPQVRVEWHAILQAERKKRLALYRERMVGPRSLWHVWRAALPSGEALERASIEKLRTWASFLDPQFEHATRVASLAVRLFDGLTEHKVLQEDRKQRSILEAAALMHEVGCSKQENGHKKRAFRMLRKLSPPPGWSVQDMVAVAIIARYHRGAVAPVTHAMFTGIPAKSRTQLLRLAGILRLANALDYAMHAQDGLSLLTSGNGTMTIAVDNLRPRIGPEGERLARAKYLLEASSGLTIRLESKARLAASHVSKIN